VPGAAGVTAACVGLATALALVGSAGGPEQGETRHTDEGPS
jgi:hypothetical protein